MSRNSSTTIPEPRKFVVGITQVCLNLFVSVEQHLLLLWLQIGVGTDLNHKEELQT